MKINNKIIYINGIGDILFESSNKAIHLSISIKPPSKIRVAVPYNKSLTVAKEFVYSKKQWIIKHLVKYNNQNIINIKNIDSKEATEYLVCRLKELAKNNGFIYNRVFIKNQKTIWGSCSKKNNINLNIQLFHLPKKLIDYVILHELVHTKYKNHSQEFWKTLEKYIINAKVYHKELKKYWIMHS